MTTANAHEFLQDPKHARMSATLTALITVLALIIGWGIKTGVENASREVSNRGLSGSVPSGWLVNSPDSGAGMLQIDEQDPTLAFAANNPLDISTRYAASLLPSGSDTTLVTAATARNLQRGQKLNLYRVTDTTPVSVAGREGYRVQFAYVVPGDPGSVPTVITGADYYFEEGSQLLVVTLETESGNMNHELDRFFRFLNSVAVEG